MRLPNGGASVTSREPSAAEERRRSGGAAQRHLGLETLDPEVGGGGLPPRRRYVTAEMGERGITESGRRRGGGGSSGREGERERERERGFETGEWQNCFARRRAGGGRVAVSLVSVTDKMGPLGSEALVMGPRNWAIGPTSLLSGLMR